MTQRVDPAMDWVEPAVPGAVLDRLRAESERQQLRARDDAVLTLGEAHDRALEIETGNSGPYVPLKCHLVRHAVERDGRKRT